MQAKATGEWQEEGMTGQNATLKFLQHLAERLKCKVGEMSGEE